MKSVFNFSLLFVSVLILTFTGISNNVFAQETAPEKSEITVYYFHSTHRCLTCQAVESVSKDVVSTFPKNKVKFISLNRDESENNELIEKYKISGQTLLVVKGDKIEDLTTKAFMYARNKPDEFKNILTEAINNMLE